MQWEIPSLSSSVSEEIQNSLLLAGSLSRIFGRIHCLVVAVPCFKQRLKMPQLEMLQERAKGDLAFFALLFFLVEHLTTVEEMKLQ